jgi:hypothetical protein
METEVSAKPKLPCAIKLDETINWFIPEHLQKYVKRVFGVYFFDKSKHVYCCEMTPSYELVPCGDSFEPTDEYFNLYSDNGGPDTIIEELHDYFENQQSTVHYMHVHEVDDMPIIKDEFPPENKSGVIEFGAYNEDVEDRDFEEGYVEYIRDNCI